MAFSKKAGDTGEEEATEYSWPNFFIMGKELIAYIAAFIILMVGYSWAAVLHFPTPIEVFTSMNGVVVLVMLFAAPGLVSVYGKILRKVRKQPQAKWFGSLAVHRSLCICLFVAFMLEFTVFQYNHYGAIGSDNVVSISDKDTDWSSLKLGYWNFQVSVAADEESGEPQTVNANAYFSLVDLLKGKKDKPENKTGDENGQTGLTPETLLLPAQSFDIEYKEMVEDYNKKVEENGGETVYPTPITYGDNLAVVRFNNLNRRVSSVHITPLFLKTENALFDEPVKKMQVLVTYADEESSLRQTSWFTIVDGLPWTEYIPVYPVGKATTVSICFAEKGAAFIDISLNEMIPLSPVLLRILIVTGVLFAVWALRRYDIFAVKFDAASGRQNAGFAVVLLGLILYCVFTSTVQHFDTYKNSYMEYTGAQYEKYLPEAILNGHLNVDIEKNENFLAVEKSGQTRNFYIRNQQAYGYSDVAYYNGKFFVYFGIVPALLLFVPYTAITGGYLPLFVAMIIFSTLIIIFQSILWRKIVKRFIPEIKYVMYLLGNIAFCACSLLPLQTNEIQLYEIAQTSGMMFIILGLLLLFNWLFEKMTNKRRYITLSFCCICFALAVGCRPALLFVSLLVPVAVWTQLKQKETRIKTIISVVVPYILIGVPLALYNYARFGSFTEFGLTYNLANEHYELHSGLAFLGAGLYRTFTMLKGYLFQPLHFSTEFPFFIQQGVPATGSSFIYNENAIGILFIPIMWWLFSLPKSVKKVKEIGLQKIMVSMPLIGIIMLFTTMTIALQARYETDFMWLFALPAIICICLQSFDNRTKEKIRALALSSSSVMILFTAFVNVGTGISTTYPNLSAYLVRSFSFLGGI